MSHYALASATNLGAESLIAGQIVAILHMKQSVVQRVSALGDDKLETMHVCCVNGSLQLFL